MTKKLTDYADNEYSQSGEDGILAEILDRLGVSCGTFCEFGAWDGIHLSNCYRLLESESWEGVMIEADKSKFEELKRTASEYPERLEIFNRRVAATGKNSLDNILDKSNLSYDFDILSIDVDGPDYYIWQGLSEFQPKVVVIEYNRCLGPDLRYASSFGMNTVLEMHHAKDEGINTLNYHPFRGYGSSFKSMAELGNSKGYNLVSATQQNMIFVHSSVVDLLSLDEKQLSNPQTHWQDEWTSKRWCNPLSDQNTPFYSKGFIENMSRFLSSIKKNGISQTIQNVISIIFRDIF